MSVSSALLLFICVVLSLSDADQTTEQPQRPIHVVVIVVDDVGVDDVGYSAAWASRVAHKYPETLDVTMSGVPNPIRTPFLDDLAVHESIRLTSYYTHPTCTPSRASLLTGRYAHNIGLNLALFDKAVAGIPKQIDIFPQYLKSFGYKTHIVGKWHVGHSREWMLPTSRGFDSFFGLHGWGFDNYRKVRDGCVDLWNGTSQVTPDGVNVTFHATEMFTNEAVKLIQAHNSEEPFFLYLAYTAAHDPLQADEEYLQKCAHVKHPIRREFCAMMAQVDAGIERVIIALKEKGMWEDTMVVFTSDNGGNPLVGGFNYPFTGSKVTGWEGGIRAPGFIKPPASLHWGVGEYDGMVHISDFLPTVLAVIQQRMSNPNFKIPEDLDGKDLSYAFSHNSTSPRKTVIAQQDIILNATSYINGCLKLVMGCPGPDYIYRELDDNRVDTGKPSARLFCRITNALLDFAHKTIELFIPPPADQFIKWFVGLEIRNFEDWLFDTTISNFFTRYQRYDIFEAPLFENLPTLELEHKRARLYNICRDPFEFENLADTMPNELKAMYDALIQELTSVPDPLQLSCDAADKAAPDNASCAPWLSDTESVPPERQTLKYLHLHGMFFRLKCVVAVILALLTLCLARLCCCCYRLHKHLVSSKVKVE